MKPILFISDFINCDSAWVERQEAVRVRNALHGVSDPVVRTILHREMRWRAKEAVRLAKAQKLHRYGCTHEWVESSPIDTVSTCRKCGAIE